MPGQLAVPIIPASGGPSSGAVGIELRVEGERRDDDLRFRPRPPQSLGDQGRARDQVSAAGDRPALGEREQENVAELAAPRRAEIAVEAREIVDVHDGRQLEPAAGRRRLGLLQVRDVCLGGHRAKASRERAAAELAARPEVGARPRARPRLLGANSDELDREVVRRLARERERLPRSDGPNGHAVRGEAAEQPDRALSRRASLGERRLGQRDCDAEAVGALSHVCEDARARRDVVALRRS